MIQKISCPIFFSLITPYRHSPGNSINAHPLGELMKSTRSAARKLNLNRETIKLLSDADVKEAQGAQMKTSEGGGNCYSIAVDTCGN
jgi:hypothetical protein